MKRKMKREKIVLMRRSVNVIALMMVAMYTLILLSSAPVWVMSRDFVVFSLVAVLAGLGLQQRNPKLGGAVTLGAGLLQTGMLLAVIMMQSVSLPLAVIMTLLYTLPIITLGAAQLYNAQFTIPPDAGSDEGQLIDTTRLEANDSDTNFSDGEIPQQKQNRRFVLGTELWQGLFNRLRVLVSTVEDKLKTRRSVPFLNRM
jgi:hypothetical protein